MWVDIAENDDNGNRAGFAPVVNFGILGSLWANDLKGVRFSQKGDRLRVSRKQYYYTNSQDWAGSMIYNSYLLPDIEACALLNDLHKSEKYHWEDLISEVDEILKNDGVLLLGDFIRLTKNTATEVA